LPDFAIGSTVAFHDLRGGVSFAVSCGAACSDKHTLIIQDNRFIVKGNNKLVHTQQILNIHRSNLLHINKTVYQIMR